MHVNDIKVAVADPAPNSRGRDRTKTQASDRTVVWHRDRTPRRDHEWFEIGLVFARRENADVMPEVLQRVGEVANVLLHTTRGRPVVGADDSDAHWATARLLCRVHRQHRTLRAFPDPSQQARVFASCASPSDAQRFPWQMHQPPVVSCC